MNRKNVIPFLILTLAAVALAQTTQQKPFSITLKGALKLPPGVAITRLAAVDRSFADVLKTSKEDPKDDFLYEGQWDFKTSTFTVPKLLPGKTYDLIVWTKDKDGKTIRWEGTTMDYHRAIKPDKAFDADDRKWIEEFLAKTPQFYDKCRPLWFAADHAHATVVVELARTDAFYASKGGEVIYRVELWYFERLFGGWQKDANTEKVLARWRGPGEKLPAWQFVPALGGIAVAEDGTYAKIEATLPEKPDPKRGTVGGLKRAKE